MYVIKVTHMMNKEQPFDIHNHYLNFMNDYKLHIYKDYVVTYTKDVNITKYLTHLNVKYDRIKKYIQPGCYCELNAKKISYSTGHSIIYMINSRYPCLVRLPDLCAGIYGYGTSSLSMTHHAMSYFEITLDDVETLYVATETTEHKIQFYATTDKQELFQMLSRRYLYIVFKEEPNPTYTYINLYVELNENVELNTDSIVIL
jgi:hypothetical protein